MAKDQAARGELVDTISDTHLHGAGESDHDSSNLRQEEVKSKRGRKAAAAATGSRTAKAAAQDKVKSKAAAGPATAEGKAAARRTVKGRKAAKAAAKGKAGQGASKGKALTVPDKPMGASALHKLVKGVKQLKKALQPRKPQRGKASAAGKPRIAGKADSKRLAAVLKTAKRAELAPSAAAKLPQPKPAAQSPPTSPQRTLNAPRSPARSRGRPKGSTKTHDAARDMLMPAVLSDTPEQQAPPLPPQQQQQSTIPSPHPSAVSAAPAGEQVLGRRKRKRDTFVGMAAQDERTLGDAVHAIHQKTVQVVRRWMSGGRHAKHTLKHKHAALPEGHQLPHAQPEFQVTAQPAQQAQQMAEGLEPGNPGQDSCAELQQSSCQERSKRRRVTQTTAETPFTGKAAAKHHCNQ